MNLLETIRLEEFFPILFVIYILHLVGLQMMGEDRQVNWWTHRLAAVAFVGYSVAGLATWSPRSAWDLVSLVLRAVLAAGLVLTVSRILLAMTFFVYRRTVGAWWQKWRFFLQRRRAERERRRQWERERENKASEERDRQAREAEDRRQLLVEQERQERAAQEARKAQRRRDDARARCELLFTLYVPEIGNRFTRPMLDAFLKNYMGNDKSPDEVEERAKQLEEILNQHRSVVRPAPRFKDIEDLAHWYVTEKHRIENLPVDPMFKEQHLVQLHTQYAELTQQVMEQQT